MPSGWQTGANTATWSYRPDGLLASRTWNGATAAVFGYDAAKRPTSLTKGSLLSLTQTYDRGGNVTSEGRTFSGISGDAGSATQSFTYDGLDRVSGTSGLASSSAFAYDLDGNRVTKTEGPSTFTYTYDRADQLATITKSGNPAQSFAYDAYGNLTADVESGTGATAFGYDLGDKLTSITPQGGSATTLTYDALGRPRTRAVPGGGTDTYSYAGSSKAVTRVANSVSGTTDSIVDPSGGRLGVKVGASTNWFVPDLHGNLVASLSQGEAAIVNAHRFDAWGQTVATGGSGSVGAGLWKYQGRLDLSPSSQALYDFSARFYAPGLGTFTQLDSYMGTAGDPLSLNRYLYAHANPATMIDPTGHVAFNFALCDGYVCGTTDISYAEATTTTTTTTTTSTGYAPYGVPNPGYTVTYQPPPPVQGGFNFEDFFGHVVGTGLGFAQGAADTAVGLTGAVAGEAACALDPFCQAQRVLAGAMRTEQAVSGFLADPRQSLSDLFSGASRFAGGFRGNVADLFFAASHEVGRLQEALTGADDIARGRAIWDVTMASSVVAAPVSVGVGAARGALAARSLTSVRGPSVPFDRVAQYGGAATDSPAAQAIRISAEGQVCPRCGQTMISGTKTAPVPEHSPPLVIHYYERGGWLLTPQQARAYARSADAFGGALCWGCQLAQGGQLSWYSRLMKQLLGL